ncbi:MAG: hypothetical protein QNJ34_20325 [Xenococcaceae cyanobacterium MO_188.B29]|nr:hypothetical protein [Xenococcaceae cyanobacterium MO_188.B29]
MSLDFLKEYGGSRLAQTELHSLMADELLETAESSDKERVILDYETTDWKAIAIDHNLSTNWRPKDWQQRPIRFIDGKDVGQTIAWVRAPSGQLVPIRLSQIGSIAMRVENGECRREFHVAERVVSMEVDLFPWTEIESFAAALQENGFRLLTRLATRPPEEEVTFDFDKMRKIAQNRSKIEMELLEKAAISYKDDEPTLIDGPLETRRGGFNTKHSPVVGVIKKPRNYHLTPYKKQLLYQLEVGQRSPVFCLPDARLPVVTWYLRLAGVREASPSGGVVRIEVCQDWFENCCRFDWDFVDKLSRTICEYRCREQSYDRANVSLHPIVRGEESLGALFDPPSILNHRFYRLTQL